jgi:GNAT superfamily N-acetyltransferase
LQIITLEAEEAAAARGALEMLSHYAFITDDWPGADPVETAQEVLAGLAPKAPLWAVLEAEGWQWLAGLERLEFDSSLFGWPMARIRPLAHRLPWPDPASLSQGKQLLNNLIQKAGEEKIDFLSAQVPARDFSGAQALEACGFYLADLSVEWMVEIKKLPPKRPLPPQMSVRTWRPEDKEALMDLAAEAFCDLFAYTHRFALDPRLRSQCGILYRRWTANSLSGDQADQVFVLEAENLPMGFITLKLPPAGEGPRAGCGWVVLNAIHPRLRGQGLYRHLLLRGLGWLNKHGAQTARVRTKVSQLNVINAFSDLGGRQVSADLTFHLWLDQIRE